MTIDLISSLQKHGKKENISYILKMIIINNSEKEKERERIEMDSLLHLSKDQS